MKAVSVAQMIDSVVSRIEEMTAKQGDPPAELAMWIPPAADRDSDAYFDTEKPPWNTYQTFLLVILEICDDRHIAPAVTTIGAADLIARARASGNSCAAIITELATRTTSSEARTLLE